MTDAAPPKEQEGERVADPETAAEPEQVAEGLLQANEQEIEQAKDRLMDMTPADLLTLERQLETHRSAAQLPEAGGIIFGTIYGQKNGAEFSITARGITARDALENLVEGLKYAKQVGFDVVRPGSGGRKTSPPPRSNGGNTTSTPPPAAKNSPAPAPASAPPPTAEEPTYTQDQLQGETHETRIVKMEIIPAPNERAKLQLYAPNHRYPDFYVGPWPIDNLAGLFESKSWGAPEQFTQPWEGSVDFVVTWEYGAQKKSGKGRYQDVVSIRDAS